MSTWNIEIVNLVFVNLCIGINLIRILVGFPNYQIHKLSNLQFSPIKQLIPLQVDTINLFLIFRRITNFPS